MASLDLGDGTLELLSGQLTILEEELAAALEYGDVSGNQAEITRIQNEIRDTTTRFNVARARGGAPAFEFGAGDFVGAGENIGADSNAIMSAAEGGEIASAAALDTGVLGYALVNAEVLGVMSAAQTAAVTSFLSSGAATAASAVLGVAAAGLAAYALVDAIGGAMSNTARIVKTRKARYAAAARVRAIVTLHKNDPVRYGLLLLTVHTVSKSLMMRVRRLAQSLNEWATPHA